MPTGERAIPTGYVGFSIGHVEVVSLERSADSIRAALESGAPTLHEYARRHAAAKPFAGRGVAYAAPLPRGSTRVVVRHNRHGGLVAALTRDLFLAPTRAPLELEASLRLSAAGVPTPELIAYAVYPAPLGFRRCDVVTREVEGAFDFSEVLTRPDPPLRSRAWTAVAELLRCLSAAGARHHDLNVKNVLLHDHGDSMEAFVLDVDRVTFESGDVMTANVARLSRSARKWRERQGASVDESELAVFARTVFEASLTAVSRS